uniref:GGDEF domain-containing protein n=1 Tax=Paractinoplanes polyasparticus TaxID=2856853 RepID=UPI001C84FC65|nr:GGDEF domain-containing protein [Actinoplanes polyasparticus]
MSPGRTLSDEHVAAIEQAYALIEAAQGEKNADEVDAAARSIAHAGWGDVDVLLHFARALAVRELGEDYIGHVQEMVRCATEHGSPSLLALALGAGAGHRVLRLDAGATSPFNQAVCLLDNADGPAVHRVAALIEVGQVAHMWGFWEIAVDYHDQAEQALETDPRWAATTRRQQIVIAINRVDLALDWCCAQAMIGDWEGTADRARQVLPGSCGVVGDDWPPSWIRHYHGHRLVLAALADAEPEDGHEVDESLATLARAIRAVDPVEAARLANGLHEQFPEMTPGNTRLLAMSLAARRPGTPDAAIRYGDELARLRWNDRLERMAAMRDAIDAERRRLEHEQLRRDVLTDDLTGLANRRGYQAYVTGNRGDSRYAVMMIDVDHFKSVNDRFGHDVGDLVLAAIGEILGDLVRPIDLAARLGGDEFVVVLADVTADLTQARAQEVVDAVREHPWPAIAPGLAVSVSVGVHHGGPDQLAALAGAADRRLYEAKSSGRGRVVSRPSR